MIQYSNMKLVAMTLGSCVIALIVSMAFFKEFTPYQMYVPSLEASVIATTVTPDPIVVDSSSQILPLRTELIQRNIALTLPITYLIGESHTYENGLSVTLQSITETNCEAGEDCLISPKLVAQFSIMESTSTETIILGSAQNTTAVNVPYEYSLVNMRDTEATIIITPHTSTTNTTSVTTAPRPDKKVATSTPNKTKAISLPSTQASTVSKSEDISITEFENAVVAEIEKQTNSFRISHKLSVLSTDTDLAKNATRYSVDLLTNNYLSHTDKRGCDISCRFANNGYSATAWGENLAMMSFEDRPSVEYVANFFMTQWEKSAGHRENLLSKAFTHQGIGVSFDQNTLYVVVQFANPN